MTFQQFCGGPLWNNTELVTSSWPKLTDCFRVTVLVWIPCGIVFLFGPLYIIGLRNGPPTKALPIRHLNAGKLFCPSTMAILTLIAALQKLSLHKDGADMPPAHYVADAIQFITYITVAFFSQYERKYGVTASRLQLAFWFFMSLSLLVSAYTKIIQQDYIEDFIGFMIFMINYALCLICFCLSCWSEYPGPNYFGTDQSHKSTGRAECPVIKASALSLTFFCWIFKLLRTGYKRDIEESDLWSLPPDMICDSHFPKFEKLWKQEVHRCRSKMKSKKKKLHSGARNGQAHYSKFSSNEQTRFSDYLQGPTTLYTQLLDQTKNEKDEKGPEPSLMRVLWKQYWFMVLEFTWTKIFSDIAVMCGPLLLKILLVYMANRHLGNEWQGYCICILMLIVGQLRIAIFNYSMWSSYRLGMIVKSVLITAVYKKAMRINNESKKKSTVGDIVNLMSVDAQRIQEFLIKVSFCHTTPLQVVVSLAIIYSIIGPAVLAGTLVIVLFMPLSVWIASKQKSLFKKNLTFKDTRIRMMNEIINGIKALKLYAWESSFHNRVQGVRASEIAMLLKIAVFYVVTGVCWNLAGYLMTLLTFATYLWIDPENFLDPGKAFMTLSLFNILRTPLDFMASIISLGAQAYVSVKRIGNFLQYDELKNDNVIIMSEAEHMVTFERADLTWDSNNTPTLKNINLHIPKGHLVAVVGQVGAGKSSLISSIIGDMEKIRGTVTRRGTVAYVPQQAWIQNATVRDNITFGKKFRDRKYKAVVSACELERDFEILTAGDQTEIGEKGINLSGGQKQRVSVARAVYQDCDLYLLDDPLSAVDSHVGKAMFDQVIGPRGLLKNKTRVLVTHGVHFLPQVDLIVVMSEGQITEVGSYEKLLAHDGPFAQFLKNYLTQEQLDGNVGEEDPETVVSVSAIKDNIWGRIELLTSDAATSGDESRALRKRLEMSLNHSRMEESAREDKFIHKEQGKLITTEILSKGRVAPHVYLSYVKAAGVVPITIAVVLFWCFQGISVGTNYWLTGWTEDSTLANRTKPLTELADINNRYLLIYTIFGIGQALFLVGYYYLFWTRMVMAGRNLHSQLTSRLFKAPMAFFDTTPIGRILNRCSRDIEVVDNFLPIICRDFMGTFGVNFMTIIVIMVQTPIFGAVLVPVIIFFFFVLSFYIPTSRQLRRIEHIKRSPIYSHFSESVTGASVIRAYGVSDRFISQSKNLVDENTIFFYAASMALRWLSVNLDTMANLVIFASGIFQILSPDNSAGDAGLTVSYALQISGSLPWMVRQLADFETNIVSVERLKEYSEVGQEADWIIPSKRPHPTWPAHGDVEFCNFSVRYRDGLDMVIHRMNVKIQGGEKVGIVGRTGAGKSSLSLSLFRLMEAAGGCIMIDGVNIAELGLHDLRSRLTILPQDPVLFSGTLRMNLDPFDEFNDEDIWTALERAHLKVFVHQLPEKLMYECGEEGHNLSVGQRQLVCLARTLLRKTKILVLDEATAAVDMQTDTLIQNTIRFAFQNCTIIAIAHRLNTILDYDKVLVLDSGLIKEFDTPSKLLANTKSVFHSMAADANLI
ncbi:multidrug resistance-associated protein 1-like isoform X2 [Physella acuta]|uniref:multidrug resistance-associated protein 1-like isoform X2 n=1 Tax=Physella acuta TaxID=109671 RepID=UPI0027DE0E8B|nr:multidrug resistance-associated protein 1-like isoform X2 [Physella acuta]